MVWGYFGLSVDIFDNILWHIAILACLIPTRLHSLLTVG